MLCPPNISFWFDWMAMHARLAYARMEFGSRRKPCPVEKPPRNSLSRSIWQQLKVMSEKSLSWMWMKFSRSAVA